MQSLHLPNSTLKIRCSVHFPALLVDLVSFALPAQTERLVEIMIFLSPLMIHLPPAKEILSESKLVGQGVTKAGEQRESRITTKPVDGSSRSSREYAINLWGLTAKKPIVVL
jgi:hypothetical protein